MVELDLLAVLPFPAIGREAAGRGLDAESQVVVFLHPQWLLDVGENAAGVEHTVELQTVGHEVGHAVDCEGLQCVEKAVAAVASLLDVFAVVEDTAVF